MRNIDSLSRRSLLQALAGEAILRDHGPIKPAVSVPAISVVRQDGAVMTLAQVLKDRGSALQLMFTQCETTCPMQGAIFERVQKLVSDMAARNLQLVSLSIDPASDTAEAMQAWLKRFQARPEWIGVKPTLRDLAQAKNFFGIGRSATDDHSTRVHMLNRRGQLVWRTSDLPSAEEIAGILNKL